MKNKVSIITGVAGTIGSNLAEYLTKKGHYVYGIDNFSLGSNKNLSNLLKKKNFNILNCDVSNLGDLQKIKYKKKVDYIWLLAANSDIKNGLTSFDNDLKNTLLTTTESLSYFIKYLKPKGKICFSSSSAIYGPTKEKIKESNLNFNPISNYGESKLISEIFIKKFCKKRKINYLIMRFPNVVGKPFTHGIIYDLGKKILKNKILYVLGNGEQKKPYIHVKELVQCMFFLMEKKTKYSIYLLGPNDNGVKVKEIVNILKKNFKLNKKTIFEKKKYGWLGDVPEYKYNVGRLNKEGFKFKNNSKQAVVEAIKERVFF